MAQLQQHQRQRDRQTEQGITDGQVVDRHPEQTRAGGHVGRLGHLAWAHGCLTGWSRSIVSTSKGKPAARKALVTASAGAEGSADGSRRMTR